MASVESADERVDVPHAASMDVATSAVKSGSWREHSECDENCMDVLRLHVGDARWSCCGTVDTRTKKGGSSALSHRIPPSPREPGAPATRYVPSNVSNACEPLTTQCNAVRHIASSGLV